MSIQLISGKIARDISHLEWQSKIYHLDREEQKVRFERIRCSYQHIVPDQDREALEVIISAYERKFNG